MNSLIYQVLAVFTICPSYKILAELFKPLLGFPVVYAQPRITFARNDLSFPRLSSQDTQYLKSPREPYISHTKLLELGVLFACALLEPD